MDADQQTRLGLIELHQATGDAGLVADGVVLRDRLCANGEADMTSPALMT